MAVSVGSNRYISSPELLRPGKPSSDTKRIPSGGKTGRSDESLLTTIKSPDWIVTAGKKRIFDVSLSEKPHPERSIESSLNTANSINSTVPAAGA